MFKIITSMEASKLQWLQDPSKINGDNLNSIICETSRHFVKKENELAMNSKIKNIRDLYRGINDFEKG
jgi:hypothetical protein